MNGALAERGCHSTSCSLEGRFMSRVFVLLSIALGAVAVWFLLVHFWPNSATDSPSTHPPGMVWIPEGTFWRGSDNPKLRDAKPVHQVAVDGFWMDATPVTNEHFEAFVKATGYVTL